MESIREYGKLREEEDSRKSYLEVQAQQERDREGHPRNIEVSVEEDKELVEPDKFKYQVEVWYPYT